MENATRMTAKEYLSQTLDLDKRIDSKLEQLVKLRSTATRVTATITDMPRSDSPPLQSMEGTVAKIIDLEADVTGDIDALVDLKRDLMSLIKRLPLYEDQMLLEQRYLCCKTWPKVAEFFGCKSQYIYTMHNRALEGFEKVFAECD